MLVVSCDDVTHRAHAIRAALTAGIDTLQLRDRGGGGRAVHDAALLLRAWTRTAGAALVVNDRLDVARAVEADGAHLPATSFPIAVARKVLGPGPWIGRSTHAPEEAHAAADAGADYVVLGPIYDTPSKRAYGTPLGPRALGAFSVSVPIIAIGGITTARVPEVIDAGATGIAVIREVLGATDPAAAAAALVAAVRYVGARPSRHDAQPKIHT